MFDTVSGLPVHILVVHAVVVLVPLMALVTLAFTIRPLWRPGLGWAVLGNVVAVAASLIAKESGEQLEERLKLGGSALISDHAYHGDRLPMVAAGLLIASVVAMLLVKREKAVLTGVSVLLVAVTGAAASYYTYETGHSGSTAVWGQTVANTNG